MDKLRINGGKRLVGAVRISGAKNAALPILAATLLTQDEMVLHNVPQLTDVRTMGRLLCGIGVSFKRVDADTVIVKADCLKSTEAPYDLVKTMRASILVLGPLVARMKNAKVSLPGGCSIGARPVDQHIKALKKLGADVTIDHGYVLARTEGLVGNRIVTDMVTVTGTENILMAAVLAKGRTVIENAAREPEVVDLANCLIAMGARIEGAGTPRIEIEGVEKLHGCEYSVIADRIETGTFLCAAVATQGDVLVTNAAPATLEAVIEKLRATGATIDVGSDWIRAKIDHRPKSVDVRTVPHPGFPTDMQAQFMALNAVSSGTGKVVETIFENRFMHVPELQRMGADITVDSNTAVVRGVENLQGANVMATDLRASASLIVAALAAKGESVIDRIYHLDRGYEMIEEKLTALGAEIERIHAS